MSELPVDKQALLRETLRYDRERAAATISRLGAAALTMGNNEAIYDAEDIFNDDSKSLFDPEQAYGYQLFSVEVGRISLTSEPEHGHDHEGNPIPHTVLAAWIDPQTQKVEMTKFRQTGEIGEKLDIFPDDWHIMNLAVEELGRVNKTIESRAHQ